MLAQIEGGNRTVVNDLLPLLYDELKKIADLQLRRERKDHTLNATALVHEAYVKLIEQKNVSWQNRAHFLAVASVAMRRILLQYARNRIAQKRGGDKIIATFDENLFAPEVRAEWLVDLDEALSRLQKLDERQSKVVEMAFFGGLTHQEIAEVLGVSVPTVRRSWRLARAWLAHVLSNESCTNVDE